MRKLFYSIFFLLLAVTLKPQGVDSVLIKLKTTKENIKKIKLVHKAAKGETKDVFNKLILILDSLDGDLKDAREKGELQLSKGNLYKGRSDYNPALGFYFKALKFFESCNDTAGQADSHFGIGTCNYRLKNFGVSLKHFYSSNYYGQMIGVKSYYANNHSMIGTIFKEEENLDSSLFHHNIALNVAIAIKDNDMIADVYNDIGIAYKSDKQFEKALEYVVKALHMKEKIGKVRGIAGGNINIGNILRGLKRNKEAVPYYDKGVELARSSNNSDFYTNGLNGRARNYKELGEYKKASEDFLLFIGVKDSLTKTEIKKQISELEINYQTEKKDADLKLQQEQLKAKTSENSRQKLLIFASVIALLLSFIAIFFIYRSFKLNKKNAIQLSLKNHIIEEKNKEITDSINYAKIIQQSLLPELSLLENNLDNFFVLFQPKDIVSGDFYWASEIGNTSFLIAAVDCTGHGVPGAFMSLLGKENLDKAIVKYNSPKDILGELNRGVKRSLKQNEKSGSRDGMDAVLVKIEKGQNGETKILYAGANRSLIIIRSNGVLEEIKATKYAIGGFTPDDQVYEEHKIFLSKGDSIYLSTDGYADQFGSDKNKKMTTKRFKEFLVSIHNLNSKEQKQKLENFMNVWKGSNEQLDDILVIGIKV